MNRRGFLGLMGGAAAAAIALPPLLELPSTRTIFLPPRGGWITSPGSRLLTAPMITREALRILDSIYPGDVLTIGGIPQRFVVTQVYQGHE